jgi:hypothetical protein
VRRYQTTAAVGQYQHQPSIGIGLLLGTVRDGLGKAMRD